MENLFSLFKLGLVPPPPKPFTDEWCRLHPGQGQCPDDIVSVPLENALLFAVCVIGISLYVFVFLKRKNLIKW